MVSYNNDSFSKLQELVERAGGCAVMDGGLATQLEFHGANLHDPLWSALCLISMPELIYKVHWDYLEAGAEILVTASYQATIQGFESKGLSLAEGEALLKKSVSLACQARDSFWEKYQTCKEGETLNFVIRAPALVAASIGSYGAFLADGSEYSGDYGPSMTLQKLKDFHRRRLQILANAGADLLAIETIPSKIEAKALVELLEEEDVKIPAWISFNSKDGVNAVSGDPFVECISLVDKSEKVVAVGINCTPPRFVDGLIILARKITTKPILVYPNSGESYDPILKEWLPSTGVSDVDYVSYVETWKATGAAVVGGCCHD
ncbi:hypothetical protein O6H91_09G100000 [Diphasiastrum complanatum]|uniref:Uncharacterized protein n=1 Tax=Diphasiastrum complanatum TaxID=34168 RepID=A0ACC2CSE6_DIPCM|nr:hypothetical protein O6H91_09G100000 [Diphasiastrum complanatum]